MFNNPFGSFHDMVAEAKEERERLDRLLTVSVPRESVAVVGVALVVVLLGVWLFLGSVSRSLTLDGVVVGVGEDAAEGKRSVQALVSVGRGVAAQLVAGAPVVVRPEDGAAETILGTVAAVAAAAPPEGLAEFAARVPVGLYRVDVVVDSGGVALASLAGRRCRMVVELGEQAPVALVWKASGTAAL